MVPRECKVFVVRTNIGLELTSCVLRARSVLGGKITIFYITVKSRNFRLARQNCSFFLSLENWKILVKRSDSTPLD